MEGAEGGEEGGGYGERGGDGGKEGVRDFRAVPIAELGGSFPFFFGSGVWVFDG